MKEPRAKKNSSLLPEALARLESAGYRLTKPRKTLLEKILTQKGPFSAAGLASTLNSKDGCDLVTIYRSLAVFEELGVIEKCDFSDEMAYYEVSLQRKGHHHHIVCKSCRKVEPLDFCILDSQQQSLQKKGYTDLSHRLEFLGVCPQCSKAS